MLAERPTRRRVITILAAAAGTVVASPLRSRAAIDQEWQGVAMGADARILFSGVDPHAARAAIATAVEEIGRLERALSLFRSDSEICRLNRDRRLKAPSGDLRRALALALAVAEASGGLFDPTVQALWEAYVDWFASAPAAGSPADAVVAAARQAVDWRRIAIAGDLITLGVDQRITLNGLGQGYVTDRVADLLRGRGFRHVLVDLGEQRALGPRVDGTSWHIGRAGAAPIPLVDGALATSEGAGCVFGTNPSAHHLFDPRTGRSAAHWRRLTVHHRSAAVADALSTALYVAAPDEMAGMLARCGRVTIWATDHNGREWRWRTA